MQWGCIIQILKFVDDLHVAKTKSAIYLISRIGESLFQAEELCWINVGRISTEVRNFNETLKGLRFETKFQAQFLKSSKRPQISLSSWKVCLML